MTVDLLYNLVFFICNKNQRGNISHADFNNAITQAQNGFVAFLLGEFQKYQPGRPIPNVALGMNRRVRTSLSVTMEHNVTLNIDSNGNSNYPAGYVYVDAISTTAGKPVRYIEQHHLAWALSSTIDPVADNPVYTLEKTRFQFYPVNLGSVKISYVKTPPNIVYGVTTDVNGRATYNAGTSVHPVWSDIDCFEIVSRALRMFGVHLEADRVSQFASEIKQIGQ